MNPLLLLCPAWGVEAPPLGLATMAGALRARGRRVAVRDLNIELHDRADAGLLEYWQVDRRAVWLVPEFFFGSELEAILVPEIRTWAAEIVQGGYTVVGMSVYHTNRLCSLLLAEQIKRLRPEVFVVLGGADCRPFHGAGELVRHPAVDCVVTGEGEEAFHEVLNTIPPGQPVPGTLIKSGGRILDGGVRPPIDDLDSLAFADFSDLDPARYGGSTLPILGSRGCTGRCTICNERRYWEGFRTRSAARVAAEMEHQFQRHGIASFHFNDSLVNGAVGQLRELCSRLAGKDFTWSGAARAVPSLSKELLALMKRAGCTGFSLGIESGSQRVVNAMRKGFNVVDAIRIIRQAHELDLRVSFNIIVGFPGETLLDFMRTIAFLWRIRKFDAELEVLSTCLVSEGSELAGDPERFSVVYSDDLFWISKDGKNTYPRRLAKLTLIHDVARLFGIKVRFRKPPRTECRRELGYYYRTRRDNRRAVRYFLKALRSMPQDAGLLAEIADAYRVLGNLRLARRYLAAGLAVAPGNAALERVRDELARAEVLQA
ncbi:radical SAM protein [bacterium]|nr:radical SAM protein [candidate division CSSED10-310 bacterium]